MDKHKKTIHLLVISLFIVSAICVISLLRKGTAATPISLFMYKKDTAYFPETSFETPNFWDNYPYWILISKGQTINLNEYLDYGSSEHYLKSGLFFRVHYSPMEDSLIKRTVLNISASSQPVIILVDDKAMKFMQSLKNKLGPNIRIIKLYEKLSLDIEKLNKSYFFTWANTDRKIENLFFPRKEIPEVTKKYLHFFKSEEM